MGPARILRKTLIIGAAIAVALVAAVGCRVHGQTTPPSLVSTSDEPVTLAAAQQAVAEQANMHNQYPGRDDELALTYAREFQMRKWLNRAVEQCEATIRQYPDMPHTRILAAEEEADILEPAGQVEQAIAVWQSLLSTGRWSGKYDWRRKLWPFEDRWTIYTEIAELHRRAGQYREAADTMARLHTQLLSRARAPLRAQLAANPVLQHYIHAGLATSWAQLCCLAGQPDKALAHYEEAQRWYAAGNQLPADWPKQPWPRVHELTSFNRRRIYTIPAGEAECYIQQGHPELAMSKLQGVQQALEARPTGALLVPSLDAATMKGLRPAEAKLVARTTALNTWVYRYLREVDVPVRMARCLITLKRFAEARACLERAASALSDADFIRQCPAKPGWVQIDLNELTPNVLVTMRDIEIPNLLKSCSTQATDSQK